MVSVAFLKIILKYLNALIIELEGNGKIICDLIQSVFAFRRKLDNFEKNIAKEEIINFLEILEDKKKNFEIHTAMFLSCMSDFLKEFEAIFQNFSEIVKLS